MKFSKKIILTAILGLFFGLSFSNIYAYTPKEWNLPGITLIKRSQWISDESLIYKKNTSVVPNITDTDETESVVSNTLTKAQTINSYLSTVFPEQVLLNGIIRQVNGQELLRSRGYKRQKSHIVVHHTVNDLAKITTPEQAKAIANSIFRYHTVSNGR